MGEGGGSVILDKSGQGGGGGQKTSNLPGRPLWMAPNTMIRKSIIK